VDKGSQLSARDALLRRQIEVIDLTRFARKEEDKSKLKRKQKRRFVALVVWAVIMFVAGYYESWLRHYHGR
jgi:hypothetical protein